MAALPEWEAREFERRIEAAIAGGAGEGGARSQGNARRDAEGNRHALRLRNSRWKRSDPAVPEMVGGSADLTGSNNTRTKAMKACRRRDSAGRFIHYGIREHGMAAAMNGMTLHGGIIPLFGAAFLVFSDYCRPSIRLAALMGERVIHVMTHDSIGLGEDGPTHQPVEHLAALRAIPNLLVFRPCRRGRSGGVLAARARSAPTARACWR